MRWRIDHIRRSADRVWEGYPLAARRPVDPAVSSRESDRHRRPRRQRRLGERRNAASSERSAIGRLAQSTFYPTRQIITKMNRTTPLDSKVSLDVESKTGDPSSMLAHPFHLYIERVDPERNMARFYLLTIEPTLFGTPRLVRRWGRIGTGGQEKVHHFEHEEEAVLLFLDLLRIKRARGYRPKPIQKTVGNC